VRLLDGNDEEAIKLLQKAKAIANETNEVNDDSHINRILALALAANGNTQQAVFALNEAINQYSEDLNTEKVRSLTKAQMNFDFEKERASYKCIRKLKGSNSFNTSF
jgi:tetratricopeptide (TPR) repeat protein